MSKRPQWHDRPELIEVLWEDHHLDAVAEARPYMVASLGYVSEENEKVIRLAPSVGEDGEIWRDETITIVKKCIVRRRRIAT